MFIIKILIKTGTTVSATSICANEAQIPIFCTGGIGGVHRDFIDSMDVSADLQELARTPVAVVSSGIKSILDIEKTLEYLETMGVCVVTLEKNGSTEFPCFFTSKSGFHSPYNCKNELDAAKLISTNLKTGLNAGLLIGVPIPKENEADKTLIDNAIQEAIIEMNKLRIKGKKVTPFLLDKINKITKGQSLKSNIALIKNNARVSARIAVELKKIDSTNSAQPKTYSTSSNIVDNQIAVIGGCNLDYTFKLTDEKTINIKGVTQPCEFAPTMGGVARNMSEALFRLGIKNSILITTIGNDMAGQYIAETSKFIGLDTSRIEILDKKSVPTGMYSAIFDTRGELTLALGNMEAHDHITPGLVKKNLDALVNSEFCVIDADIPMETIEYVSSVCEKESIPVWFNPTDLRKCYKIINSLDKVTYMSPNSKELFTLFSLALEKDKTLGREEMKVLSEINAKYKESVNDLDRLSFDDLKLILKYLLKYVPFIVLTRGVDDLILASAVDLVADKENQLPTKSTIKQFKSMPRKPQMLFFPIIKLNEFEKVVNVSGAGDSNSSGMIAGIVKNYKLNTIVYNGLTAAKLTIMSNKTVSPSLNSIYFDLVEQKALENQSQIRKILL